MICRAGDSQRQNEEILTSQSRCDQWNKDGEHLVNEVLPERPTRGRLPGV